MASESRPGDFSWPLWPILPIYPYSRRRTLRREIIKDSIWTFEQLQGIFYVVVPIRMTIVKLATGGLLVYAPVAPTRECLRLVQELTTLHGDIRYILLPTVSGLEHKVFVGPFARHFPQAQVFVAPHQWSFPFNLPLSWLGFPSRRTQILPEESNKAPFADEFDYEILTINLGGRTFGEVALCHRRSGTLLITDSVLSVPEEPLEINQWDPYPLLFHARDQGSELVEDTPVNRRKGWQRISLFALYFRPSTLEVMKLGQAFRDASQQAPDRSRKAYFGIYPFKWRQDWQRSFAVLHSQGQLLVAPILQTLILNRGPKESIEWADRIARWNFERIIPCHFAAPIDAGPYQFRQAFTFLEKSLSPASLLEKKHQFLPEEDFALLKELDETLIRRGITPLPKELR
ncbi:hypothetical protein BST81_21790 [Leptolyngbya sp. 'hensonii']|nr:DUF4336 domain-containing protein [Leptolyngbya sp. 'hensonii']OLP16319.1 hypothetical protein BST81_21790 [Leptolyngbya sp. 'hensonii']